MANEFVNQAVGYFVKELVSLLSEATALSKAAGELSGQGLNDRAMSALLDLEPLLHDAIGLINAAALTRRRTRRGCDDAELR